MTRSNERDLVDFQSAISRRHLLRTGSLSLAGLSLAPFSALKAAEVKNPATSCILLMLVGGPSHLDTFDMKPDAPAEIRGPYRPIRTNVPGIEISEIFPRTARHADKFSIVRSMHYKGPAVHEVGHQFMQTGRSFEVNGEFPSFGSVQSMLQGSSRGAAPRAVLLPHPIGNTGGSHSHGHSAGFLGNRFDPVFGDTRTIVDLSKEPEGTRARYGWNSFGQNCLRARKLVESGTRFVTVNMFDTIFDQITWDIHGSKPFSPLSCYKDEVGPMFDKAYSSLLSDLQQRGLLQSTMVWATGEFGRTPKINPAGGRDHWPECWSILAAGGPVRGGTVVGASDKMGREPKDRPVTPAEVAATIYHGLGIHPETRITDAGGNSYSLVEPGAKPVKELLA